mmetsp:Transcript_49872/g.117479  ORF Transcript_49872/g.117479 Transcript_49872/m.117479 type:complete len:117 (-) Transcript_49872:141-491(-)
MVKEIPLHIERGVHASMQDVLLGVVDGLQQQQQQPASSQKQASPTIPSNASTQPNVTQPASRVQEQFDEIVEEISQRSSSLNKGIASCREKVRVQREQMQALVSLLAAAQLRHSSS